MRISAARLISISLSLIILNLELTVVSDAQLTGRKFLEEAVAYGPLKRLV